MSLAEREQVLTRWALAEAANRGFVALSNSLVPVSGDASFRRYFRLLTTTRPLIAVDAPPDRENCRPFVAIARALRAAGLRAPEVIAVDFDQGLMLLEDFGDALLLPALDHDSVDDLYTKAMEALLKMQHVTGVPDYPLPPYDRDRLMNEMHLLRDWFVKVHLGITLDENELAALQRAFDLIAKNNLSQPAVFVHRDFHSRNLMLLDGAQGDVGNIGLIDFQDAVTGPVTYDLVSLLRDAYIVWEPGRVRSWAMQFAAMLREEGRLKVDDATFLRWFDWMGAQRHIKVIGIFARLYHRDGKNGYLADIPRVMNYLLGEIHGYNELAPLDALLRTRILPAYLEKNPDATAQMPNLARD